MPKIAFIEPKSPGIHIFSMFPLPRLGSIILASIAKKEGWDASVHIEEMSEIDFEDILEADVIGISTITSTAPRAYEIAKELRSRGKTVIMGGPHVTFMVDEALQYCDFVVRGEGEIPIRRFLAAYMNGKDFSAVEGLSYRINGVVFHNKRPSEPIPLDQVPRPDFSLVRSQRKFTAGLTSTRVIPLQTTRGCPFNCVFCSVTDMFGRKVRYRDVEEVVDELRQYSGKGDVIFFYDDNFTVDKRRTRRLVERIIEEKLDLEWTAQVRADVARDPELLRLMRKSGCFMVYIGFESVNQKALDGVDKSQTVKDMERAIREFKKAKIKIHGMFVLGFEEDSYKDVMSTVKFAVKRAISTVQFLILTPLPGSATFAKLKEEGRILFQDWGLYDGHHVVFKPKSLSVSLLQKAQLKGHARFYSRLSALKSLLRFRLYKALIATMACRYQRLWIKGNAVYLKAIRLLEKTHPYELEFSIRTSARDVKEKIEAALESMKQKRFAPISAEPQTDP